MNKVERDAALTTLQHYEARQAKLRALIEALREDLGLPVLGEIRLLNDNDQISVTEQASISVVPQPYADMTLLAAAQAYLHDTKKPQTTRQVAAGIKRGGYQSVAKSFNNTVYTRLYAASRKGKVFEWLADKQLWALREWRKSVA